MLGREKLGRSFLAGCRANLKLGPGRSQSRAGRVEMNLTGGKGQFRGLGEKKKLGIIHWKERRGGEMLIFSLFADCEGNW